MEGLACRRGAVPCCSPQPAARPSGQCATDRVLAGQAWRRCMHAHRVPAAAPHAGSHQPAAMRHGPACLQDACMARGRGGCRGAAAAAVTRMLCLMYHFKSDGSAAMAAAQDGSAAMTACRALQPAVARVCVGGRSAAVLCSSEDGGCTSRAACVQACMHACTCCG